MVRTGTFPLLAIGGSHASGLVQVTERDGSFVASVSIRGLASGMPTLHTVHIHAGSCSNPYAGRHLTVLGLLHASPTGAGSVTAPLAPFYVANGHYLIIYANTSPQVIVSCANLMSLS
jgi:Cu/Zn superoxide dismutase